MSIRRKASKNVEEGGFILPCVLCSAAFGSEQWQAHEMRKCYVMVATRNMLRQTSRGQHLMRLHTDTRKPIVPSAVAKMGLFLYS